MQHEALQRDYVWIHGWCKLLLCVWRSPAGGFGTHR
jgi:hypothetical protein